MSQETLHATVGAEGESLDAALGREEHLELFRHMLTTRAAEERGHVLYRQGKVPGSYYTGRGNEGASVGVASAMGPDDVGTPLHRNLGVHITRGMELWQIFAQYLGRVDGPTRGRESSVHLGSAGTGLIAMVSHLPALLPVAVGAALAFLMREEERVAVAWFGDGSAARGDVHEAMNLAGVHRLPVVFVCDNNQWAYSTPTRLSYACERLSDRAQGYGFGGVTLDGTDVLAVHAQATEAIERARAGGGPTLLELSTLRMEGHSVNDDASYVPDDMREHWARRDPIERFRSRLIDGGALTVERAGAMKADADRVAAEAARRAESSPLPDPAGVADGVYADDGLA